MYVYTYIYIIYIHIYICIIYLLLLFSGYVDGLKKLLFTFPKENREEIIKKYASRTPEPSISSFQKD